MAQQKALGIYPQQKNQNSNNENTNSGSYNYFTSEEKYFNQVQLPDKITPSEDMRRNRQSTIVQMFNDRERFLLAKKNFDIDHLL